MGNRQSSSNRQTQLTSKHHQLNGSKITSFNKQVALKTSPCLDRKEYQRWWETLDTYNPHPSILLPLQHTFLPTNLCGTAGNAQILYPNFIHLLHDEIFSRLSKSGQFLQPELWYLLYTLISAKKVVMERGEMLGDIRPKNILLNEKGRIKVPTSHSWPSQLNKYQKIMASIPTYLSPQEVLFLKDGSLQSKNMTQQSQMFAIGLTMLSAINLQDYEILYQCQNMKFRDQQFQAAISQLMLNNKYSQVLRSTVTNLCSFQPARRMALNQLFQMLSPHAEQINLKKNFVIYNAPNKLHEEVNLLRSIIAQKTAQYPSELPDRTSQALQSEVEFSLLEKLVPSHLNQNTSSAYDLD